MSQPHENQSTVLILSNDWVEALKQFMSKPDIESVGTLMSLILHEHTQYRLSMYLSEHPDDDSEPDLD
jgi:hypothetical protein